MTASWPPYHWLVSPEIGPVAKNFWRVKFDQHDLEMYERFLRILRLSKDGRTAQEIGRILGMNNVGKFLTGKKMSFLTRLRSESERLGQLESSSHRWLPSRLKPRGTPGVNWVEVPTAPLTFQCIKTLLAGAGTETGKLGTSNLKSFGFRTPEEIVAERTDLFGFLLGAIIGDCGKRPKGSSKFSSRSISLVLSKNKPNSFRFGEFVSLCANASLGLGMHRVRDSPISDQRYGKTECYCWNTAASPLTSWIFNECLGLAEGETTTYSPLRMEWIHAMPDSFKTSLVQGLSESDGWPSPSEDKVRLVSSPNTALFKRLLEDLGSHPKVIHQPPVELLTVPTEEANRLPFFSPRIDSNLYRSMAVLAAARRWPGRVRLSDEIIGKLIELSKTTSNASEVCLRLAETTSVKVSGNTVRKYTRS
ncbi:MAG: hypothetical protein HY297_00740 [Thaumarchaeota archaeon]|nr:hypothetical protein [Nitrososphaerota archaeon]